jgi:hypothetical protein
MSNPHTRAAPRPGSPAMPLGFGARGSKSMVSKFGGHPKLVLARGANCQTPSGWMFSLHPHSYLLSLVIEQPPKSPGHIAETIYIPKDLRHSGL